MINRWVKESGTVEIGYEFPQGHLRRDSTEGSRMNGKMGHPGEIDMPQPPDPQIRATASLFPEFLGVFYSY